MTVLGVDSSATSASAAIFKDNILLSEAYSDTGLTHSQTLLPIIDNCMKMAGVTIDDIDLIAISNGPGSFTGVRIGLATVKGIAFTNNIPCVEVSTLEGLAYNVSCFNGVICSVMDARCNQVYTALFESDDKCKVNRLSVDEAISIDELGEKIKNLNKPVILVGDGAKICYDKLAGYNENLYIAPENVRKQKASSVALCAFTKKSKCAAEIAVNYIRLPQAQRELAKKQSLNKE